MVRYLRICKIMHNLRTLHAQDAGMQDGLEYEGGSEHDLHHADCMDTRAKSLKGKTLGRFNATCVARSAVTGLIPSGMWSLFTFQEVLNTSVTSVMRSLTPKASGPHIAPKSTLARRQSEC